ncbi:type IV pili methyl-accepting chemotaxis transducer N-terminal domain-containing protein [Marinobacterium jannaschii]|uniref:type IV pili methyl-accepting chemotaxis transducer N-terminal domain-containing protein n=1 Tax=Marinobacterium jannaschii TaxID=64970 RepID=UPI000A05063B|nr:type IV pili methyl-accepting chemotaxis transducer N-terminal domain-containing protein [Marinobacterium jannaschii]
MQSKQLRESLLPILFTAAVTVASGSACAGFAPLEASGGSGGGNHTTGISSAAWRPVASAEEAITVASELRMLTQRMYKDYVFSGLNVRARKANHDLEQAMQQFEFSIARLSAYAYNEHLKARCAAMHHLWLKIKPIYQSPPDKANVRQLRDYNNEILRASYANVTTFMVYGDSEYGQMVNLAGEQTMLSQRIAALYGLMSWGFEDDVEETYSKVENDFRYNLEVLLENLINTPGVDRKLDRVKRQFASFERSSNSGANVYVPALIDRSAERMLREMLDITNMYAELSSN